jgi:transcriptional regulator with XRE-family HTH domain
MTLQEQVNDNVRVLAAARGTSPSAVAEAAGRSRQWIQNKLSGRNGWSVEDLEAVADSLGVEPAVLMTEDWWPDVLRACRDSNPKPSDSWNWLPVAA